MAERRMGVLSQHPPCLWILAHGVGKGYKFSHLFPRTPAIHFELYVQYMCHIGILFVLFETGFHRVALVVLELSIDINSADPELPEIHLPLPPKCCDKGVSHHICSYLFLCVHACVYIGV